MGSRLLIDVTDKDDICFLKLSGIIDEDNDLAETVDRITKPRVVINTADVDRINSCGVRDWVTWLGEVGKSARIYFVECSPAIMTQVNLVNNFISSGIILSFYAPYFCGTCEADKILLLNLHEVLQFENFSAPICRCDKCDNTMEFDDIESSFFAFLPTAKTEEIDEPLKAVIDEMGASSNGSLRPRSSSVSQNLRDSSSQPSSVDTPTPSGTQDLEGLLASSSKDLAGNSRGEKTRTPGVNKILYIILGLLAVAVVLLSLVVIKVL